MSRGFKVNQDQLYALLAGQQGPVWNQMLRIGNEIQNVAKAKVPVDNGRLRNSIKYEMRTEKKMPVVYVGTKVKYAIFVHNGTGVHGPKGTPITPKTKQFLSWRVRNTSGTKARYAKKKGKTVYAFAKKVQGVRPRPFLTDAMQQVLGFAGPFRT
jgi:hypothetical protein